MIAKIQKMKNNFYLIYISQSSDLFQKRQIKEEVIAIFNRSHNFKYNKVNNQIDIHIKTQIMQAQQKKPTSVFYWGKFRDQNNPVVPKEIGQLSKCNITKVQSGGFFYLAANDGGQLWGWGSTKNNRYGVAGAEFIIIPKKIPLKVKVNKISAGNWHSLITDTEGMLHGTGHNKYGSLGVGNFQNINQFTKAQIQFPVSEIAAGDGFSIIISQKGQMYGAGHNSFHGHKSKDNLNLFKRICQQDIFTKVCAGFTHALAINQKGQVYSWGQGNFYQLGHGNKNDVKTPKKIQGLADQKAVNISCTRGQKNAHSMAATIEGNVYTWGAGYKGKLGHFAQWSHADPADQPVPKKISNLQHPIQKVYGGGIHSGILTKNGELMTFGCGSDGRLGHIESTEHKYLYRQGLPRKIDTLNDYVVIDAAFSYYHNICVAKKK